MYTEERIKDIKQAEPLLNECGLTIPQGVEYTVGIFDEDDQIVATGSIKGDMIQGMAVSPLHQGEDLSARVLTHLINKCFEDGKTSLNLFTKPSKAAMFSSIGFKTVAVAKPYAALLEWGKPNIDSYTKGLKEISKEDSGVIGGLVMNCNPITNGHLYLIETAASLCDKVYILVVEEDISLFPFQVRYQLVKEATKHIPNVVVVGGGRYCVSSMTFPSYFTKDESLAKAHCSIDLEIFKKHIAPALGITKRFVGTEPLSPVTNVYNETMKELLPEGGIEVTEILRKEELGEPISASRVRKLLQEKNFEEIKAIVPECTYQYITQNYDFLMSR